MDMIIGGEKQAAIEKLIRVLTPIPEAEFGSADRFVRSLADAGIVYRQFRDMNPDSGYSYMLNVEVREVMLGLGEGGATRTLVNTGIISVLTDHDLIRRSGPVWRWVWSF